MAREAEGRHLLFSSACLMILIQSSSSPCSANEVESMLKLLFRKVLTPGRAEPIVPPKVFFPRLPKLQGAAGDIAHLLCYGCYSSELVPSYCR